MTRILTFGEIMLRLSPPGQLRFTQAASFDVMYGGGEANVAVSLALFGLDAAFVSRIPANPIGDSCLQSLRQNGVDTRFILRGGERLGIYFLEHGAAQRASSVVYDRAHSAFAQIQPGMVDWDAALASADWFHWTGITPAVSQGAAETCLEAVKTAKRRGIPISCDLNYRAKLWQWGKPAGEVMSELVSLCDVAIGNEEDAEKVFGIHAAGADVTGGRVSAEQYQVVCEALHARFPSLKRIAITLRGSRSASHNTWSAALWQDGRMFSAPTYDILPIVDRVGGGDSFAAGLIYGLTQLPDPQQALNFAVAASALKHSIFGDFNLVTRTEVEKLAAGDASGRFSRPNEKTRLEPKIAYHHPVLDALYNVPADLPPITDGELDDLIGDYIRAAQRAQAVGFDFVDVKHCRGYLGHELLSARPGRYGGSFENRTRFLREIVARIQRDCPGLGIGVRLSAFDFPPFRAPAGEAGKPLLADDDAIYGFGTNAKHPLEIQLDETIQFLELAQSLGIELICLTAGSPYYNPHIQRPALFPASDGYAPPEDPLVGVARQIGVVSQLKEKFPALAIVGSAYTYLQDWLPNVAQAVIRQNRADFIGLGRMMLAYPKFPADVLSGRPLNRKRICRTFSDCTTASHVQFHPQTRTQIHLWLVDSRQSRRRPVWCSHPSAKKNRRIGLPARRSRRVWR